MAGALLEVLLALAVGVVALGVHRGWFASGDDNSVRPTDHHKVAPFGSDSHLRKERHA
jgi:hypothetical protein